MFSVSDYLSFHISKTNFQTCLFWKVHEKLYFSNLCIQSRFFLLVSPFRNYLFIRFFCFFSKISWLTKQGFSHEYIEEVIASDALNEPQDEEIPPNDDVDKELKAAQDAAKAAGEAAKNVFGKWYLWLTAKN